MLDQKQTEELSKMLVSALPPAATNMGDCTLAVVECRALIASFGRRQRPAAQVPIEGRVKRMQAYRKERALPGATADGIIGEPTVTEEEFPLRNEFGRWTRPTQKPTVSAQAITKVETKPEVDALTLAEITSALEGALSATSSVADQGGVFTRGGVYAPMAESFSPYISTGTQRAYTTTVVEERSVAPPIIAERDEMRAAVEECKARDAEREADALRGLAHAITVEDEGSKSDSNHEEKAQFVFNEDGEICAFFFSELKWTTEDGYLWTARTPEQEYRMRGYIKLEPDGTLQFCDSKPKGPIPEDDQEITIPNQQALAMRAEEIRAQYDAQYAASYQTQQHAKQDGSHDAAEQSRLASAPTKPSAESQHHWLRLRALDEYVRPSGSSWSEQMLHGVSTWYAQTNIRLITQMFGKTDKRLIAHLDRLAELYLRSRLIDQAQRVHWHALRLREHNYGRLHRDRALNLEGLAKIYYELGHYDEAAEMYKEAVAVRERTIGDEPRARGESDEKARERDIISLLTTINDLAQLYAEQEIYSDAEVQFKRALDIWNALQMVATATLCNLMHTILRNYKAVLFSSDRIDEARALEGQTYWLRRHAARKAKKR